jgi:hypothetical protein
VPTLIRRPTGSNPGPPRSRSGARPRCVRETAPSELATGSDLSAGRSGTAVRGQAGGLGVLVPGGRARLVPPGEGVTGACRGHQMNTRRRRRAPLPERQLAVRPAVLNPRPPRVRRVYRCRDSSALSSAEAPTAGLGGVHRRPGAQVAGLANHRGEARGSSGWPLRCTDA